MLRLQPHVLGKTFVRQIISQQT
uniref:Uncharacterized protein n=1 Tax=Rhizophora mucronata TaxID=61149 RepID=A0A2P2PHK9_RHIMU